MKKIDAIEKLGGSKAAAAMSIGISYQAVSKWPDNLTPKIRDRVQAAFVRMYPRDWAKRWPDLTPPTAAAPTSPQPSVAVDLAEPAQQQETTNA